MTTKTIPAYLEDERQKAADSQLRVDEEAARIQPLHHGHHRMAKQPRLELVPPPKTTTRKKKRKTAVVARKKVPAAGTRAAGKRVVKTRKRA